MTKKIIFVLIIFLAFFLRFYKLGEVPLSLNWDETSNAYNAYSILKTGRDEYGNFLPLSNRSFDDYKPPLYMYLNVPTVSAFGLTPFAARLPSAFLGVLTVALLYFLVKRLTENSILALASAFLLAVSSWHAQFSRIGFESNIGLSITVAAFTAFIRAMLGSDKSKFFLLLSAILFALSAYSYHSQRVFVPLMFFATLIIYRKEFMSYSKRAVAAFFIIILLIILPLFIFLPNEALFGRFETVSQKARLEDIDESIRFIRQDSSSKVANLIHNRRVIIGLTYVKNYLLHFDLNYLFTRGDDNPRFHTDNMGMLYFFQLPLILFGLFLFLKEKSRPMIFLLAWLFLSPIAAITGDAVPHSLRSFTAVIPFTAISAFAVLRIYSILKLHRKLLLLSSIFIFMYAFFTYFHDYYIHHSIDHSADWQYGNREAVLKTAKLRDQYERINISSDIDQAYIFWLFNLKYDPSLYIQNGTKDHFDKFYFKAEPPKKPNVLYVGGILDGQFNIIDGIYSPKGEKIMELIEL